METFDKQLTEYLCREEQAEPLRQCDFCNEHRYEHDTRQIKDCEIICLDCLRTIKPAKLYSFANGQPEHFYALMNGILRLRIDNRISPS